MSTETPRRRRWRPAVAAAAAIAVTAGVAAATPDGTKAPSVPRIGLVAASTSVTLDSWKEEPGVYLDLGTYLTASGAPLELRVSRKSYKDPVVATQIIRTGTRTRTRVLPAGLVKDFSGLPDFIRVTVRDSAGRTVAERSEPFCPNNASGRIRPDAPATSKFPESCPTNPFTLGSVWGVENGWASNTYAGTYSVPVVIPPGKYTAEVAVTERYRDLFGISGTPQSIELTVRERSWEETPSAAGARSVPGHGAHHSGHTAPRTPAPVSGTTGAGPTYNVGHGPHPPAPAAVPWSARRQGLRAPAGDGPGRTDGSRQAPAAAPRAQQPTGAATVPDVPKPDLRSLPAYGITIGAADASAPGRDHLAFSANVWNAGPAQLVVDGFRKPGNALMDAYQYFYDASGKQVGYTPTGTMEWDPRPGHLHWHFTDFASYRLLKADRKETVRSGKEAFCLANTDAVDYTVRNANWHPDNTDLSTACGQENSISVREVLDVGSGDTYTQDLPGQSFDITGLPNGTYFIQVLANPEKRLEETDLTNNSALRKVVLGGEPGARTVTVPRHDLVDAP